MSGRPREYAERRRIALDMAPADILKVDEFAIINGMSRVKAINLLTIQALEAPRVVQAVAEAASLSIPEPQSQLATDPEPETGQIGGFKPSWIRKLAC